MNVKWLVPLVVVFASTAHADATRPKVNAAMARAVGEIKACGPRYTATFDWTAYDAVDWSKTGHTKQEWLLSELGTLDSLGTGVDRVCADPDCKAALGGIDTIVYRITDDKRLRLLAKIEGKALVFTNYTFGSTRDVGDFEAAARSACEAAALPAVPAAPAAPAKQRTNAPAKPAVVKPAVEKAPAKAAPTSTAWDGTYQLNPPPPGWVWDGGLCPRPEGLGVLQVASGKLSLPWSAADWRGSDSKPLRIGRVDGIVHANGTVAATATFDAPIWQSMTVSIVKIKRQLDSVGVKMRFSRDTDRTKLLVLAVTIPGGQTCNVGWERGRPKPQPIAAPKPTPTKPNVSPAPSDDDRREAERGKQKDDEESQRRQRETEEAQSRRTSCHRSCEGAESSCNSQCGDRSQTCYRGDGGCLSDKHSGTYQECSDACTNARQSCTTECTKTRYSCDYECNDR